MSKTIKEWRKVYEILDNHVPFPTQEKGEQLCFNSSANCEQWKTEKCDAKEELAKCPHLDYYQVTSKELAVKVDSYNLVKDSHNLNTIKEEANEDKEGELSNVTVDKNYKMTPGKSDDDYFKYIPSKDERNTMLPQDQKLEEEKELPEDYFRSVNEFQSKYVTNF